MLILNNLEVYITKLTKHLHSMGGARDLLGRRDSELRNEKAAAGLPQSRYKFIWR